LGPEFSAPGASEGGVSPRFLFGLAVEGVPLAVTGCVDWGDRKWPRGGYMIVGGASGLKMTVPDDEGRFSRREAEASGVVEVGFCRGG